MFTVLTMGGQMRSSVVQWYHDQSRQPARYLFMYLPVLIVSIEGVVSHDMMNVPLYKVGDKIQHYKINTFDYFVNLKRRPHVDHVSGVVCQNKRIISNKLK